MTRDGCKKLRIGLNGMANTIEAFDYLPRKGSNIST
jgi:hypothetical protein